MVARPGPEVSGQSVDGDVDEGLDAVARLGGAELVGDPAGEGRVGELEQRDAWIERGHHGVGDQPLATGELHRPDPTSGGIDAADERLTAHSTAEAFEAPHERRGQCSRSAHGVPLSVAVIRGLPEGEEPPSGRGRARARMSGERCDGPAGEIRRQPALEQPTVGARQLGC